MGGDVSTQTHTVIAVPLPFLFDEGMVFLIVFSPSEIRLLFKHVYRYILHQI